MPTLAFVDSFQHRVLATVGGWYDTVGRGGTLPNHGSTGVTFDTGTKRTEQHVCSLKLAEDGVTATSVRKTIAQKVVVTSFYFLATANPSVSSKVFFATLSAGVSNLTLETNGSMNIKVGSGTAQSLAGSFADGKWHRVDIYCDTQGATATMDCKIDGVAFTQATLALATANMTSVSLGSNTTGDSATVWYQDWVFGHTSGDYPYGDHICKQLLITADGSSSPGSGAFQDEAGGTTNLYQHVDDAWDGTTPELSQTGEDHIKQTVIDGAGYRGFAVADPPEAIVWGAQLGCLMAALDSTTADTCECRMVDSGGTTLFTTGLIDPSGSATAYNAYRPFRTADPSGGWSGASLVACEIRWGFSTDVTPNPVLNAALIEYVTPWPQPPNPLQVFQEIPFIQSINHLSPI